MSPEQKAEWERLRAEAEYRETLLAVAVERNREAMRRFRAKCGPKPSPNGANTKEAP